MWNAPHVSLVAAAFPYRPLLTALLAVFACTALVALGFTLPGRAPEGVVLGVGTSFASMLATARPHQLVVPLMVYAVTAIACVGLALAGSPPPETGTRFAARCRFWLDTLRLGGFWLAVPAAVIGAAVVRPPTGHLMVLAAELGVFVLVVTAARRRGRDLTVGYVAGLLVALAALVASGYGRAAGDGTALAYPAGLTGLIGVVCAARIGLDRAFPSWQRAGVLAAGAITLVVSASPVAFTAAGVACVAYAVGRMRGPTLPRQLRENPVVAVARSVVPLIVVAGLWILAAMTSVRARQPDFARIAAFGRTSLLGRLLGYSPASLYGATGWIGLGVLVAGAILVAWRVTGPGLPLWVPVAGLGALAGLLLVPVGPLAGPSPGWVMVLGAELWVSCHGLRTDRNVVPAAPLPVEPDVRL